VVHACWKGAALGTVLAFMMSSSPVTPGDDHPAQGIETRLIATSPGRWVGILIVGYLFNLLIV